MTVRTWLATAIAVGTLGLGACDGTPDGPGTVVGTVTGDAQLGAAVLEITWRGVQGFEGLGSTRAYSAAVPGEPDRHRVVLVAPDGGDLRFGIRVDDVYLEGPVVTVVAAARTDNRTKTVSDLRVLLER